MPELRVKALVKGPATEAPDIPDSECFDGALSDMAIQTLKKLKAQEKPFFLAVGYIRPHLAFIAPRKYWDLYQRDEIPLAKNPFLPKGSPPMAINSMYELKVQEDFLDTPTPHEGLLTEEQARRLKHGYYACVSFVDAQIGRLIDALDELGLRKNTIIVLWGDHGWKLGEHASWGKMTNYENDTLSPLIICAPAVKAKGAKSKALVEFVDIYSTLCELAGLELPPKMEGTSLVPLLEDPNHAWKTAVFSQYLRGTGESPDKIAYMGNSIRTERYRYVEWLNWETKELVARELYDHKVDPDENINIADLPENKKIVEKLASQLKAGWRAAKPK